MGPAVIALDTLPRDALCHITSYLHGHELLGLRCQSKHCRESIRYAAAKHPGCSFVQFRRGTRVPMEARIHAARAFGHACRHLTWSTSDQHLIQNATRHTAADDLLVEWCRTAPNLVRLDASEWVCINMERAAAIGRACPLLEDVKFCGWYDVSPAEGWAKFFPKLRQVRLSPDQRGLMHHAYVPTDLVAICETVRVCESAVELYCDDCRVPRPVVDLFIGTPFGNRLRALSFSNAQVAADGLLACARGFPQLRALVLPKNELGGVPFYETLARARPELAYLEFSSSETAEDSHVVAACSLLSLRCLVLYECSRCGDDYEIVDGILASSTAASLEEMEISHSYLGLATSLRGFDILRLVLGCPRLRVFGDFYGYSEEYGSLTGYSDEDAQEASRILYSRGGYTTSPNHTPPHPSRRHILWSDGWKPPDEVRFTKYSTR